MTVTRSGSVSEWPAFVERIAGMMRPGDPDAQRASVEKDRATTDRIRERESEVRAVLADLEAQSRLRCICGCPKECQCAAQ